MKSHLKHNPLRPKSKLAPIDMKAVARRRLECVDEIERMRELNGTPTSFAERAHALLLPRYWQDANWRTRAEILDSVEWLLRLGRKAAEASAKV